MVAHKTTRAANMLLAIVLAAGFAYSGVATLRHVQRVFQAPAAAGRTASIDAYLAPVNLSSGEDLRRAVRCIGSVPREIVLLADGPALSRNDLQQISYAAGYLLYPHRIVIRTGSDALPANGIRISQVQRY